MEGDLRRGVFVEGSNQLSVISNQSDQSDQSDRPVPHAADAAMGDRIGAICQWSFAICRSLQLTDVIRSRMWREFQIPLIDSASRSTLVIRFR